MEQTLTGNILEASQKVIKENKDLIMLLTDALMQYETITKEQIESIVKTGKIKPELFEEQEESKEKEEKKITKSKSKAFKDEE